MTAETPGWPWWQRALLTVPSVAVICAITWASAGPLAGIVTIAACSVAIVVVERLR